jgi:hypothetical protein
MPISHFTNPGAGNQRFGHDPRLHLVGPLSSAGRTFEDLQPRNALIVCLQESLQRFLQR